MQFSEYIFGVQIMIRKLTLTAVIVTGLALPALADDKKIIVDPPGPAPSTIIVEKVPDAKPDAASKPSDTNSGAAATAVVPPATQNTVLSLSEQEAKTWVDKPVYSSDGKNIGEVVDFQRDADKQVIGMHADIGGFFGFGQTRVNLNSTQFKLLTDRIILDLTAAQVKDLPKVES
jgi:sporulation protein YlmC with PRC-barrel domain